MRRDCARYSPPLASAGRIREGGLRRGGSRLSKKVTPQKRRQDWGRSTRCRPTDNIGLVLCRETGNYSGFRSKANLGLGRRLCAERYLLLWDSCAFCPLQGQRRMTSSTHTARWEKDTYFSTIRPPASRCWPI